MVLRRALECSADWHQIVPRDALPQSVEMSATDTVPAISLAVNDWLLKYSLRRGFFSRKVQLFVPALLTSA